MTINEAQDEIIEEFSELDDWMDRYQVLIDLGNGQQPLPESGITVASPAAAEVQFIIDSSDSVSAREGKS